MNQKHVIMGIDPGPEVHGVVIYDATARRVLWSRKASPTWEAIAVAVEHNVGRVVIERPAAMGTIGPGIVGHMLDTAWEAGRLSSMLTGQGDVHTITRREVLRHLGVLSGTGSADSRVRRACIADHESPGGPPAVGRKATPGPLYGVSSHAWQALGAVLAWLEMQGGAP